MVTLKWRIKRHRLFNKICSLLLTPSTLRVCRRGFESPCISHTYHKVKQHNLAIWIEKWLTGTSGNTLQKIQKNPRDISSYHGLPRSIQSFVARARTGQKNIYIDSPICKVCHLETETLEHILLSCISEQLTSTCQYKSAEFNVSNFD